MDIKLINNKLYILGTAEFGPINSPLNVKSANEVFSIYGNRGTLIEAYNSISMLNLDVDIYLVKISGTHSETYLNINQIGSEVLEDAFYIKSKHSNEKYNNIKINIKENYIAFSYEDEENIFYNEYDFERFKTVQDLVEAINEDTRNLKNEVFCYANCDSSVLSKYAFLGVNNEEIYLTGGNSGLFYTKNMLFNCLEKTYSMLEGVQIDILMPLGINYDDTFTDNLEDQFKYYDPEKEYLTLKDKNGEYENFYKQLLKFCKNQMAFNCITHGVMSIDRSDSFNIDEDEYFERLKYFKDLNSNGVTEKYRCLVSVCAGDLYSIYGTRIYNSQMAYAPIAASIGGNQNTTNKKADNSFTLYNTFSNELLAKLTDLGYVSFRFSPLTKTIVVTNGVTTSDDDNFKYFCNIRMVQIICRLIKESLEKFIGENIFEIIESKKIEAELESVFNTLIDTRLIEGFNVNNISNEETGNIFINLDLKTLDMVEEIPLKGLIGGEANE